MIEVKFSADTFGELCHNMWGFLGDKTPGIIENPKATSRPPVTIQAHEVEVKRGPGRPKKDATLQPPPPAAAIQTQPQPLPIPLDEPEIAASATRLPTLEEVKATVSKVLDNPKFGMPKALELLKEFGQVRISAIPQDKWPALMLRCEQTIAT